MKLLLILLGLCVATPVWAQTLTVALGTKKVNQLHDELLAAFPAWKGTATSEGFIDPLLRVESTATEMRLQFPDSADPAAVQAVIDAHVPKPAKDWKQLRKDARKKLKDTVGLTTDELDALISP